MNTSLKKLLFLLLIIPFCLLSKGSPFINDSIDNVIYSWQLTNNLTEIFPVPIDTNLRFFQIFNPNFKKIPFNAYLGNLGSPSLSLFYFQKIETASLFFLKYYEPYLFLPENQKYFNTKTPFTNVGYTTAGNKTNIEQTLKLTHSQNINKYFNAGLLFDLISSNGQYAQQKTSKKSFSFFSSYIKDNYSVHGSFTLNNISDSENGGIADEEDLGNMDTQDIPVNLGKLNEAKSILKNRNLLIVQKYTFGNSKRANKRDTTVVNDSIKENRGLKRTLSHIFLYKKNHKIYQDNQPASGFYQDIFLDSLQTFDSVYYRTLQNTLQFEFSSNPERIFRFGGKFGITTELNKYASIIPVDTIIHTYPNDVYTYPDLQIVFNNADTIFMDVHDEIFRNTSLFGHLYNDFGETLNWNASGKYYLEGYKKGNILLEGALTTSLGGKKAPTLLSVKGKISKQRPSYWYNNFNSNHFIWKNDFQNIFETTLNASFQNFNRNLYAEFFYSLIDHFVFIDSLAKPSQHPDALLILGAVLSKDIVLWKFNFINKVILQKSGNQDILPLPIIALYNSTFFEHNIYFKITEGNLLVQLGFDLFYHSPYFANAFMPSTGLFYLQDEKELGNFPFVDLFLNLKLKRTRFFLKYENLTTGLAGNNFYTILHYPMNPRMLKFGLSWTFYD
jgi:hypothetical protein